MTWRVTLPDYPDSLDYAPKEGALKSNNDTGPANKRPRYTDEGAFMRYAQVFTGPEWTDLLDFHDNELGQGSLVFQRDDPTDDVVRDMRFQKRPQARLVRGGATAATRLWEVTIEIEILTLNV